VRSSIFCLFFFSSRRRHTRFSRDWSSDVCSSDLRLALVNVELLRRNGMNFRQNGNYSAANCKPFFIVYGVLLPPHNSIFWFPGCFGGRQCLLVFRCLGP